MELRAGVWLLAMSSQSGLNFSFPSIFSAPYGHGRGRAVPQGVQPAASGEGGSAVLSPLPPVPFSRVLFALETFCNPKSTCPGPAPSLLPRLCLAHPLPTAVSPGPCAVAGLALPPHRPSLSLELLPREEGLLGTPGLLCPVSLTVAPPEQTLSGSCAGREAPSG